MGAKSFTAHPTPPRLPWAPSPSRPRRLLHVSSTLCDTHQGKLPGSSTTSPLLLINFLVWTNRIKQFYHSSRNIHYHAGERLFKDTFFPRGGVSLPARSSGHLWFRVAREETATVVKSAGSCWGQTPELTERERTLNIRTVLALTSVAALNPHLKAPCQPHRGAPRSFLFKYSF